MSEENFKKTQSESEWQQLTSEQYRVCRQKGTERPHSGQYDQHFESGVYHCVCCGEALFESDYKFDAGCGWPSFSKPLAEDRIGENRDLSQGMIRTEVICKGCGAHLGHVFADGPAPTGFCYCINSVSLVFSSQEDS